MREKIKNEWNDVANTSTNSYNPFQIESRNFLDNVILKELGDIKGKRILDVGCGNGDFSFKMLDKGASVTGLEISQEMHKVAIGKYPFLNIHIHDLVDAEFQTAEKYDFAVLELVIMFVKDVDKLFINLKKSIKEDGEVVVVILHPLLILMSQFLSEAKGVKFEGFSDYFVEQVLRLKAENVDLTYFSRSVSWYVKQFVKSGFEVNDVSEPKLTGEKIEMSPNYGAIKNIPYIMLFRLKND